MKKWENATMAANAEKAPKDYNGGQRAEFAYTLTRYGTAKKRDSVSGKAAADFGNEQIKSNGATVCHGLRLVDEIKANAAEVFTYITKDLRTAYTMSKAEFTDFCLSFARVTTQAHNPKALKWQLRAESNAMREWLERHTNG